MSTQPSPSLSIPVLKCKYEDCGNEWVPRSTQMPKVCPKCKRYRWETGSKKKEAIGGKNVVKNDTRANKPISTAHLGPETEKFLKFMKET